MSLLRYDKLTGSFTWRITIATRAKQGTTAGTLAKGYVVIRIHGLAYKAHRLAYLFVRGCYPENMVDHKDRNKQNNSWSNLRATTNSVNQQNQVIAHRRNKTGLLGVTKLNGVFMSRIGLNGKYYYLGRFDTAKAASAAYFAAKTIFHKKGYLPKPAGRNHD